MTQSSTSRGKMDKIVYLNEIHNTIYCVKGRPQTISRYSTRLPSCPSKYFAKYVMKSKQTKTKERI